MITLACIIVLLVSPSVADYDCICNYNVEAAVYDKPSVSQNPIGYLYEFDCKPAGGQPLTGGFEQIMFEHQYAYIEKTEQVETQTCAGDPPEEDKVTTKAPITTTPKLTTPTSTLTTTTTTTTTTTPKPTTTPSTTPTPTTTSTTTPTTTSTTTPTTTPTTTSTTTPTTTSTTTPTPTTTPTTPIRTRTSTTTTSTTTSNPTSILATTQKTPEGLTDLCPDYIKNSDVQFYKGFLGQYGDYCYELVNGLTQWSNARAHCLIYGDLAHVPNQDVNNYLTKWLNANNYSKKVWIGLTDSGEANEGKWRWSTGIPYRYNNFQSAYIRHTTQDHKLNDCVVIEPSTGEWIDLPCGVSFIFGAGFGEMHPYICQYNISDAVAHKYFGNVLIG